MQLLDHKFSLSAGTLAVGAAMLAAGALPASAQSDMQDEEMGASTIMMNADLTETLDAEGLTVFSQLIEAADLEAQLTDEEYLTIFVPSNAAYAKVAADVVKGAEQARQAVFHVTTTGKTTVVDLLDGDAEVSSMRPFGLVGGLTLDRNEMGEFVVRDTDQTANIVREPIMLGENHVIFVIDTALLPAPNEEHGS